MSKVREGGRKEKAVLSKPFSLSTKKMTWGKRKRRGKGGEEKKKKCRTPLSLAASLLKNKERKKKGKEKKKSYTQSTQSCTV